MSIAVNEKSFAERLSVNVLNNTDISNCDAINIYTVKPPLVPEKSFAIEVARKAGYYNYPPTGALYLCASIDSIGLQNVDCNIIDLNNLLLKYANRKKDFSYDLWQKPLKSLERKSTQLVFLISYMFGTQKECYVNTAKFIRSKYPNSLIVRSIHLVGVE